jgi:hypothetical protein
LKKTHENSKISFLNKIFIFSATVCLKRSRTKIVSELAHPHLLYGALHYIVSGVV